VSRFNFHNVADDNWECERDQIKKTAQGRSRLLQGEKNDLVVNAKKLPGKKKAQGGGGRDESHRLLTQKKS